MVVVVEWKVVVKYEVVVVVLAVVEEHIVEVVGIYLLQRRCKGCGGEQDNSSLSVAWRKQISAECLRSISIWKGALTLSGRTLLSSLCQNDQQARHVSYTKANLPHTSTS